MTESIENNNGYICNSFKNNTINIFGYKKKININIKNNSINMKHNIEEFKKLAKEKGGICLSTEYISTDRKLKFKCSEGHIWETRADNLLTNHWCKKCADSKYTYKISDFKEYADKKGGECLSSEYSGPAGKLLFKCVEGHEWKAFPQSITKGGWCRKCGYNNFQTKFNIDDIKKKALERGFICLSNTYKNKEKLLFKCKNNHEFSIWREQLYGETGCKYCKEHRNEKICRQIFEEIFNKKFPNCRPNFLKNLKTGYNLELDGFNKKISLAFEYNGGQHYIKCKFNETKGLVYIQNNDKLKNKLCKENSVKLITIPYTVKNHKEFILKELDRNDIKV